jgi:hypothetical protein
MSYPLEFEAFEGIRDIRETLVLHAGPIDKLSSAALALSLWVLGELFRFPETMQVVGAIDVVTADFEGFKIFLLFHFPSPVNLESMCKDVTLF